MKKKIFFFSTITLITTVNDTKLMKNILQRDNQESKYSKSTYLTALSNRTVKKVERRDAGEKRIEYIILKLKKEINIKAMVLKIYL